MFRGGADRVVVFGCGGHARSIISTLRIQCGSQDIILVDENAKANELIMGCTVVKNYELCEKDRYIVAVGDNQKRKEIFESLVERIGKGSPMTLIASSALLAEAVQIGQGVYISNSVYIGPLVSIGDDVIINTSSIIEHEAVIGNHTHVAPNATVCGRTTVGNNVMCGAGSTLIDGIKICDDVIIGAGAVVVKDIDMPGTYAGIPAKIVRG